MQDETENAISGLLINDLSDHKIIFTFHRNNSYIDKVNKFINVEKRDDSSMNKFVDELTSLNICDKLDKQLTSDPNNNYEILSGLLKYAREKHLPKKTIILHCRLQTLCLIIAQKAFTENLILFIV